MSRTKLVRDLLSDRIPAVQLSRCDPEDLNKLLVAKLDEEIQELGETGFSDPAEFGDVIEVLLALAAQAGVSPADIEAARISKLDERGGFALGLVWNPDIEAPPSQDRTRRS